MKKIASLFFALLIVMASSLCVSATEASVSVTITRKGLAISGPVGEEEVWKTNDKNGVAEALYARGVTMQTVVNNNEEELQNTIAMGIS